jgi:anti-anti-sigma regulatory factor
VTAHMPQGSFAESWLASASVARHRIAELTRTELVLDLRGRSFIDRSGVHLLLELAADPERDGWNSR